MKAPTLTKSPASRTKRTVSKRATAVLSTCPTNGAGWCPYPFSIEQLERRLKEKAEKAGAEAEQAKAGKALKKKSS